MADTDWLKQVAGPAFPAIEWSKPQHRSGAGKLLIVGGHQHRFVALAEAFAAAAEAGVGVIRVVMPDSLKSYRRFLPAEAEFAPSAPSGGFAKEALGVLTDAAVGVDAILVAGDMGRNSQTAILLERLLNNYSGKMVLTQDALDFFLARPGELAARPQTLLVGSLAQARQLVAGPQKGYHLSFGMQLMQVVEVLRNFSRAAAAGLITKHHELVLVTLGGRLSSTAAPGRLPWRVATAAVAAVYWLQHQSKPFEALTTAVWHCQRAGRRLP